MSALSSSQMRVDLLPSIGDTDIWIEQVDAHAEVRDLLLGLVRDRAEGWAMAEGQKRVRVRAVGFDPGTDSIHWATGGAPISLPLDIRIEGYNTVFHVSVYRGMQADGLLMAPVPQSLVKIRQRWHRRTVPRNAIRVRMHLPGSNQRISGSVKNLSYGGLAVEPDRACEVEVGTQLSLLQVLAPDGKTIDLECQVRFVSEETGDAHQALGLRVLPVGRTTAWKDLVDDQLHPGTRIGGGWARQTWDLYERCGYFNLSGKTPDEFAPMRRAYESVGRQLDSAPQVGCQIVWPSRDGDRVIAAATALKVYSGLWLGVHMAKESGAAEGVSGRDILRQLNYRSHEHMQQDPSFRWFCTYIQVKTVWTRYIFHDQLERHVPSGDAAIVRFRAIGFDCDEVWDDMVDPKLDIGPAEPSDLALLGRSITRTRPAAYCDAFDLTPERLDLAQTRRTWAGVRLERDRTVLVVRDGEQTVAAAVLEMAAEGLHLFHLLDLVRLYSLAPGGERYFGHLLEAAKDWFAEYDKGRFVCFLEEGTPLSDDIRARGDDMGEADMCVLAAKRMPELNEAIHAATTPREGRDEQ